MSQRSPITSFRGDYLFLSNFYPTPVRYKGSLYPSSEHAYQSQKAVLEDDRRRIMLAPTPGEAKRLGRIVRLRPNWDKDKLKVMAGVLEAKFESQALRRKLIATGDARLIEGNTWGDTWWGVCNGKGLNWLGELLMALREKLQELDATPGSPGSYWLSCPKFTVWVEMDDKGRVVDTAPIARKFIGQPVRNLKLWAERFGDVQWKRLPSQRELPIKGGGGSLSPKSSHHSRTSDPSIPATEAQIRKLCAMLGENWGKWCKEEDALDWVQGNMEFGGGVTSLDDLTNGQIGKCFEELGE